MARKKFRVDVVAKAKRDLFAIRARIANKNPAEALRWLRGAQRKMAALATLPLRFELLPELSSGEIDGEYRHFLFGNYRIIYRVEESVVYVVRVIHAARLLTPELLQDEPS